MNKREVLRIVIASSMLLGASLAAAGQQPAQNTPPEKQTSKATAAKPSRVWTNDSITSLRSPEDVYVEQQQEKAAEAAQAAAKQAAAKSKPQKPIGAPAALSNPKTPESADKMIAWEDRDIQAEQQFLDTLKQRLDNAPLDQKAQLEKLVQQHEQELAATKKERDQLDIQKAALESQAAANNSSQASKTSSQ